jgi:hypothetical protein
MSASRLPSPIFPLLVALTCSWSCASEPDRPNIFASDDGIPALDTEDDGPDDSGPAESGEPDPDGPLLDLGSPGEGPGSGEGGLCTCVSNPDVIYLLRDPAELWTFNPVTKAVTKVGTLGCETSDTFSMGVARDGHAWINFGDASVRRVSLADPSVCEDLGYLPSKPANSAGPGWGTFGMAFVSKAINDPCDDLFVHDSNGVNLFEHSPGISKIGRFERADLTITELGASEFGVAELSGTGDGRLFAFFGSVAPQLLGEFDPSTGALLSTRQLYGMQGGTAFAFAFWGGDMFFFTSGGGNSEVYRLDLDQDEGLGPNPVLDVSDLGFKVVGAGVSTCAPFQPPK